MATGTSAAALVSLGLDRGAAEPMQRQLYDQIREAVLSGRLSPGARLPSTRALCRELKCSRNTVIGAFDQLLSEGYLEGRRGSGTFVSRVLPEELLSARRGGARPPAPRGGAPGVSARGRRLTEVLPGRGARHRAFTPGLPDLSCFPFDVWGRLMARVWRRPGAELPVHGAAGGDLRLRRAIAGYLRAVRAVDCEAGQVIVTTGAQQALDLAVRILLDPGDAAWIEEPGYPGLRGPLIANGARLVPVPVDGEGLSVTEGRRLAPAARLAVVSPSHQYPLGITMSLPRRLELLDWAREAGAWILEDDYDSEYRYAGRPLAALQGLEASAGSGAGRVLYVGSFSKVLFPSLRLGYLIVPAPLADAFMRARAAVDDHPSAIVQPVLARFIEEGHFAAHVRRTRALYAERQAALVKAATGRLGGLLEVAPDDAGMHLVARLGAELARRASDREVEARALEAGVTAPALAGYYLGEPATQGVMLGYAAVPEAEIAAAVDTLAAVLDPAPRSSAGLRR